jgi:hypothetical protein
MSFPVDRVREEVPIKPPKDKKYPYIYTSVENITNKRSMESTSSILAAIRDEQSSLNWQQLLFDIITAFNCSTGTIHTWDGKKTC